MRHLLNDAWEFAKLPTGSTLRDVTAASWRPVSLPHDWLIWQKDLYESADAWYRRVLPVLPRDSRHATLHFDGVYMDCEVYLNGRLLCSHPYGYTDFRVFLTDAAEDGENMLLVHIRHQSPNSRWYSGSGIFRDVHLECFPENYVVPYGLSLGDVPEEDDRMLTVRAETAGEDGILFSVEIRDSRGNPVAAASAPSRDHLAQMTVRVPKPDLWSPDHPNLYTLSWVYGEDAGEKRIGFRDLRFDPDHGFFLNGEKMKLKGVCLHHDLGALGAAFHEKAARRQLSLMKAMGANALRTSHNPPAEKLLDLCDEMGILVIDEAFDMWERPKTEYDYARFFNVWEQEDVASWIRRDRCHPSVILWSIGNEIYDMHAGVRGQEITRMLTDQVHSHDPFRHAEVTFGCNYMPWEGGQRCAEIVQIPGYNYGEKYYEEHHRRHPSWVIYGSETASVLSSRGIYHFPMDEAIMSEADLQCSALGNSNTSWGATDLRRMIVDDLANEFSMGQFIWSGIDYIGEPTPYHTRSCYFGQADTACFPKDSYYLFQSLWTASPMIHIGVTWDWNPGQMIDVPVMTNCSCAELFLNGKSMGKKQVNLRDPAMCQPVWHLPFEKGELTARGYDEEGAVLAEAVRHTPGNTAALALVSETPALKSDGYDLAFVTVSALDENGFPVENARDRVFVRVCGGGWLVGLDNGDSTDEESYKTDSRRLFGGKLLVMIASNGRAEDTVLEVRSPSCKPAVLTLKTEAAEPVPGRVPPDPVPLSSEEGIRDAEIPVRKLEMKALDSLSLSPEKPEALVSFRVLPQGSNASRITWQVTNRLAIPTPHAEVSMVSENTVRVSVCSDGEYYLRALCGNAADHPEIISQLEITAAGFGAATLNPYQEICAGLYTLSSGEIGTGNEKGVAFSRDGESMIGFGNVDFGPEGADQLILPVFALNGDPYEIELFDGVPEQGGILIDTLIYQKPSIWNCYQEETYRLPQVLRGIHTLCFRMRDKVHLRGFRFRPKNRAERWLKAGEADRVYGDRFSRGEDAILDIGNNVTLTFSGLDFGNSTDQVLVIEGQTPLEVNTISLRMTAQSGEATDAAADFRGCEKGRQQFHLKVPAGPCEVSFVFLPGSHFDFYGFQFCPA